MMIPALTVLMVLLVTNQLDPANLSSDPRVRWLRQQALRVRTVDPADEDFRDLQPLKKIIGDSRIVMLGEISHGDGTSLLAKSRLAKFLHQQMNFDVLVFESGFYDMSKVWASIERGEEPVTAVQRGLFPVWSRSPQVKNLFDYVGASAKSSRPLALAGFDLQPSPISSESLLSDLDALVVRLGIGIAPSPDLTDRLLHHRLTRLAGEGRAELRHVADDVVGAVFLWRVRIGHDAHPQRLGADVRAPALAVADKEAL